MKNVSSLKTEFTNLFNKQLGDALPEVKTAFRETLEIFPEDPDNKILWNHPLDKLGKKYFGIWSIDVAPDWRALYRKEAERIIFVDLGTHNELYG